jgi:3-oxoadipate enol-lactonase
MTKPTSATDKARTMHVGGAAFSIVDSGPPSAPCVLFGHSIMTTSAMWQRQVDLLCQAGYRAIAYDARGHGSSAVSPAPYAMHQLAEDVIGLLDALGIERTHFVGLSLGGMIAFDLLTRHDRRLLSAVICDARADSPESFARPWDERIELAYAQGMQALASPTIARWFGAGFRESADARAVHAMVSNTPVEGFVATARALQDFDFRSRLGDVNLPVTLICGDNDGVLPAEMAQLAQRIPGAVLEMIPGAGHLPNVENPLDFNAALMRHFTRLAAR